MSSSTASGRVMRPQPTELEVPSVAPDPEVLFKEARRRRHRRWLAASLLAAALALIVMLATGAGGGSGGIGHRGLARPSGGSPPGGAAHAGPPSVFAGAPATQHGAALGQETQYCRPARPARYLPPSSGCVDVRYADLTGTGRKDLIVLYSRLDPRRVTFAGMRDLHIARQAMLEVVEPNGQVLRAPVVAGPHGTPMGAQRVRASYFLAIAHVNDQPGSEIFLQFGWLSSGSSATVYSLYADHLIPAGVGLAVGGDSASGWGFDCLPGSPPRLITRQFTLIGPNIYGAWKETEAIYTWHQARLVKQSQRVVTEHGQPPRSQTRPGRGCIRGLATTTR